MNHLKLKEDLFDKETNLFRAQSTINELKKDLRQARDEVSIYILLMCVEKTLYITCLCKFRLFTDHQRESKVI